MKKFWIDYLIMAAGMIFILWVLTGCGHQPPGVGLSDALKHYETQR